MLSYELFERLLPVLTIFQDSFATARCKDERAIVWDPTLRRKDKKTGGLRARQLEDAGSEIMYASRARAVVGRLINCELRRVATKTV